MAHKKFDLPEVGSRHKNNQGQWFTIVSAKNCKDVVVEFDDRKYRKQTNAYYVREGSVAIPSIFVGDVLRDKMGNEVTVNKIDTVQRVTFQWLDGVTRIAQAATALRGDLLHPKDSQRLTPSISVGDRFSTWQGCTVTVIAYKTFQKITVKFDHPYDLVKVVSGGNLLKGVVHNQYAPSVAGVGIIGDFVHDNRSKLYRTWINMLTRVYNTKRLEISPAYVDCLVHPDWLHLGNFADWFKLQKCEDDWHLDKDLLMKGNRQYSKDACVLVPRDINTFLTDRAKHRGDWPIGVTYHERIGKWQSTCNVDGVSEYLGVYLDPTVAFEVYKKRKEAYAKELAEKWKDQIDPRAYTALMNYTVEITD